MELFVAFLGILVAAAGVWVANKQLGRAVDSIREAVAANRTASLMAVLSIEQLVADARVRFEDANHQLRIDPTSAATIELQEARREQFLNAVDRLCACIRKGYVDEDEYKADYRDMVFEIVATYPALFAADTDHRHIKHVHDAWKDERRALQVTTKPALKA